MPTKRNTHLIVDGQVFQSIARHRGMGRYSEYLLGALLDENLYDRVDIILSTHEHAADADPEDVQSLFKNASVTRLDLQNTHHRSFDKVVAHNIQVLDAFIEKNGWDAHSIDFLIPAPFQEPVVSVFPTDARKHLVFYDLIPYLYHEQYADKMPFETYLARFRFLFEADSILTISESVRQDLMTYLGIGPEKIISIHGAAIHSGKGPKSLGNLELPEKFVLMPTGDDRRKNNLIATQGFEAFNSQNGNAFKLVITSNIHHSEKNKLKRASKNIIFTGNVDEAVLDMLYDKAELVLFVPESEGLGLPILEAVRSQKRVVCSNLEVFQEISEDAFYYCDYKDSGDVAAAISRALDGSSRSVPKQKYAHIQKFYSWIETAKRAASAMKGVRIKERAVKPKIAIFTPAPDGLSAIGKVIAETHARLTEVFDVDYYAEPGYHGKLTRANFLKYSANYYPATSFSAEAYAQYDAVFYHIGNSDYHLESIGNALHMPGFVVIHDTNISDAFRVMVEMDVVSKQRGELETAINKASGATLSNHLVSVATNQCAIATHSTYAVDALAEIAKKVPAQKIELPTTAPDIQPKRDYKKLSLGLAGIIADIKGTEVVKGLAGDVKYKQHSFSLFGYNFSTTVALKKLQSYGNVEVATNISDLDFVQKLRQLDIFVNYRMKYQGETSLSTLEAMRQGVVVIVRNVGWYSELPDDVVVKVENIEEVKQKLDELIEEPERLRAIAQRAVEYIRTQHTHKQYVEGMAKLMNGLTTKDAGVQAVVKALQGRTIKTKSDLIKERIG